MNNNKKENDNDSIQNDAIEKKLNNADSYKLCSKPYFKYKFSKNYVASNFKSILPRYLTFFSILVAVLIVDLVLKNLFDMKKYDFIPNFISIDGYAHNTGAAFSIFSNATIFLAVLSILALSIYFVFEYLTMENKRGFTYYTATALIVGGTLGNLVDRLAFNYVRDFIKLEFMDFPIFNIADCALTIGVILIAIWLIFIEPREGKKNAKANI